jgi:carbonic anhydrase
MYIHPLLDRENMLPQEALDILIEGNKRFVNQKSDHKDFQYLIHETKEKQHPFTTVLSCSDSRAPVELLFDQALGDVFSVRLAGNIASDKAIGSIEYASKYAGSKLIVVMGHTGCGAVKAACDDFKDGHIGEIVNLIRPSIRHEKTVKKQKDRCSENDDFVTKICVLNVKLQIENILRSSDIVSDMLEAKEIGIVGAIYDISSGKVKILEETVVL